MAGARSALIVATDAYDDPKLRELRTPADDAAALARVLGDPHIGEFDVDLCINPKEHELRRTLSAFFADRRPEDVLLLHFGCHGLKDDDGRLYFAAADTEIEHLDATALPAEFVNRRMNDSRSKRIMLFLDCCYSGAFAGGMTPRAGEQVEVKERFEGSGRVVLTASNAMEYSFEGDDRYGAGRRSVFTSALVRGLETGEADLDQDRWISIDELYDYVFERVREQTPNQTPGKWSFVQGDLHVARSAYVAPVEPDELPAELRSMLESVLPSMRELVIPELERLIASRPQSAEAARRALERLWEDDSRRVAAAAEAAYARSRTGAVPPQPARPEPPPAAAAPRRRAIDVSEWAKIVGAAAGASLIGGLPAGQLFWASDLSSVVGWSAEAAFLAVPVALVAVLAGRSAWPAARALATAFVLAAALNVPIALIDETEAQLTQWVLFGAVCGFAALIGTTSRTAIRNAVVLGAVSSLLCGIALADADLTGQAAVIVAYFVLPNAVVGACIAVAVALAPRVTKPGA